MWIRASEALGYRPDLPYLIVDDNWVAGIPALSPALCRKHIPSTAGQSWTSHIIHAVLVNNQISVNMPEIHCAFRPRIRLGTLLYQPVIEQLIAI